MAAVTVVSLGSSDDSSNDSFKSGICSSLDQIRTFGNENEAQSISSNQ